MRPINVLSLFDGMSCGRIALERAGIPVKNHFASEIDKYAIKVSKANWPDITHLGDVRDIRTADLPPIDLLIGGSPCQGFSFAGRQLNFDDPRSALFFEFARIHDDLLFENPDMHFLLENVRMKQEYQDIITRYVGVPPVAINSALVSAQNRYRLYWTSLGPIEQPQDKGLVLADIIDASLPPTHSFDGKNPKSKKNYIQWDSSGKGYGSQQDRAYRPDGKMCTIPYHSPKSKLNVLVNVNPSGNGMNGKVYDINAKSPTLTTNKGEGPKFGIFTEGETLYRKLTPVECERLQTVPDDYTAHVSNTQRYKMLGNGWTVDVIAHIFDNLKPHIR